MPRVKVALPASFLLTVQVPVRITDLNYGAHLGNDALLSIMHEARVQFLQYCQLPEFDPATKLGLIMADVAIEYKGEGFHGDVLHIQLAATDLHRLLQVLLGLPEPVYHHHRLIVDDTGRKLAKSARDTSLRSLRDRGVTPDEIRGLVGLG